MEKQIFIGTEQGAIERDYQDWKKSYDNADELEYDGHYFYICEDKKTRKYLLWMKKVYFIEQGKMYVLELSVVAEFEDYYDAARNLMENVNYIVSGKEHISYEHN